MIDYPAALAVAMIVQTGSFEGAAKALHVTPSAVSQRVKQLEERLGVILIERGSPCTATEKGAWLCRHVENVGMLEKDLVGKLPGVVDRAAPTQRVTLNIATNADSLGTWLLKAMSAFSQKSDYLVNIAVDNEGHTADWLQRGRVLAAVTSTGKAVRGCRVFSLGKLRYHATASPAFMTRYFSNGVTAQTIARAPGLTFNQKDRLQSEWARRLLGRSTAFPTHWLPSTQGFVDACLLGMAWGLNPEPLIREHLATGKLISLVPQTAFDVRLYWQVNRIAADRLSELTGEVVSMAKRELAA